MKYFIVTMDSPMYCGFTSYWWIEAEDEDSVEKTVEFQKAYDEMLDYLIGWKDDDDPDDSTDPTVDIEECTKEVYIDSVGTGGCG